jgi:hypothetical protein
VPEKFAAMRENPTSGQVIPRPPRRNSSESDFPLPTQKPMPRITSTNAAMTTRSMVSSSNSGIHGRVTVGGHL